MTDAVYLATDVSGWNAQAIRMERFDALHYAVTLPLRTGTEFYYKYTRGSWQSSERGRNGIEQAPHRFFLGATALGEPDTQVRDDEVYNWSDYNPATGGRAIVPGATPTPFNPNPFGFPTPFPIRTAPGHRSAALSDRVVVAGGGGGFGGGAGADVQAPGQGGGLTGGSATSGGGGGSQSSGGSGGPACGIASVGGSGSSALGGAGGAGVVQGAGGGGGWYSGGGGGGGDAGENSDPACSLQGGGSGGGGSSYAATSATNVTLAQGTQANGNGYVTIIW